MTRNEVIRFLALKTIGNFLILFALFGISVTFGPALFYEVKFRIDQARGVTYTIADHNNQPSLFGQILQQNHQQASLFTSGGTDVMIPKDTHFDVLIPRIGANSIVFANVDPVHEDVYLPILKKGVAQAAGTALPGQHGAIFLFAHSTDAIWDVGLYNAVFYLLKDVQIGDDITLFYQGKRYDYRVSETKIIDPTDVSYLVNAKKLPDQLVLQTCWPPGTTWKRLLVIAKPV